MPKKRKFSEKTIFKWESHQSLLEDEKIWRIFQNKFKTLPPRLEMVTKTDARRRRPDRKSSALQNYIVLFYLYGLPTGTNKIGNVKKIFVSARVTPMLSVET